MACDRPLRSTWYRFTSAAGGVIPTYCPEEYSCGMFYLQLIDMLLLLVMEAPNLRILS